MGGEHSAMDKEGTADISPSARFGVTEAVVSKKLYDGLIELYKIEEATEYKEDSCQLIWSLYKRNHHFFMNIWINDRKE